MKKTFFIITILFISYSLLAQDPGYINTFGYGSIIASFKGYPEKDKFDPAQFDFRDNKFYIRNGEDATLDMRVILPKGMTNSKYLDKVKKEKSGNIKYRKNDFYSWRVWSSHDGEDNLLTEKTPWPTKISDEPMWAEPVVEIFYNAKPEDLSWTTSGCNWDGDFKRDMQSKLIDAKPGTKLYVIYSVGYEYQVPGGQIENKWDDIRKKWVQVVSTGLIGYQRSEPIAACTIEIMEDPAVGARFIDNGDGTMTDVSSGLIWLKSPQTEKVTWQEALDYVKTLNIGGFTDWRLPTYEELDFLSKIKWRDGQPYPTPSEWFNKHGFTNIQTERYWTSSSDNSSAKMVNMEFGGESNGYKTEKEGCVWAVRSAK